MKIDYQACEDGRLGDGAREGGSQGRGRGIMKSGGGRSKIFKCGRGAGNRNIFWRSAPSVVEKLAETARLLAGSASIVASMGTSGTTVPLWMKMLSIWHFQVYVLYTFDITIKNVLYHLKYFKYYLLYW